MKCKYCDGTGTTNWCINGIFKECPYCDGTGEVDSFNAVDVLKVMEMVKKPHTNEEWLCSCTTEEKAKVLYNFFMARTFCHICPENNVCDIGYKCKYRSGEVEDFIMWLKQPHKK